MRKDEEGRRFTCEISNSSDGTCISASLMSLETVFFMIFHFSLSLALSLYLSLFLQT